MLLSAFRRQLQHDQAFDQAGVALDGDMGALRLCLERLLPPRRDRLVTFDLPENRNGGVRASSGRGGRISNRTRHGERGGGSAAGTQPIRREQQRRFEAMVAGASDGSARDGCGTTPAGDRRPDVKNEGQTRAEERRVHRWVHHARKRKSRDFRDNALGPAPHGSGPRGIAITGIAGAIGGPTCSRTGGRPADRP